MYFLSFDVLLILLFFSNNVFLSFIYEIHAGIVSSIVNFCCFIIGFLFLLHFSFLLFWVLELNSQLTFLKKIVFLSARWSLLCYLFPSCGQWGYSVSAVHWLLIMMTALVAQLQGTWASVVAPLAFQSTGSLVWFMGLAALQHVGSSWIRD